MAQKPDGKPAKTERVTFTRPAAERIAKVVRGVEAGDRDQAGLTFGHRLGGSSGKAVRSATFTGAWAIGATNAITFRYAPTATQVAVNLTWPLGGCPLSTTTCIVTKEQGTWLLVSINLASLPSYNNSNIQLLGHGAATAAAGCLRWYDIANCSTSTAT